MQKKEQWIYWTDQIARELSIWKIKTHVVNDSKTPSGRIHIGALRGVFIHDAVYRALVDNGLKAKVFYGWDDMDALDTVPHYLDKKKFSQFVGMSLCRIPSPENGFDNYAEFFANDVIEIMEKSGCNAKFYKMSELYAKSKMNSVIKTALENAEKIRDIFKKISGSEKGAEWLPFQVVCEKCGKIGSTVVTSFDGKNVHYKCKSPVEWAVGCGYEGDISPFDGNGKLPWKVEWAARWSVLGVMFEGAGHDHYTKGGTRFVANTISEEIFGYRHPYDLPYEWFYVGGRKMSSSKGIGASAKEMASVIPPELLRFLMIKTRPQTAIDFDPQGNTILAVSEEYNRFERVYFGKEKVTDKKELNNIKRAYELSQVNLQKKIPLQIPLKTLIEIVKILPEKNKIDFTLKKLESLNIIEKTSAEVKKIVEEKLKYAERLYVYLRMPEKGEIEISENEKIILGKLIDCIEKVSDGEELQTRIFEIAREKNIKPAKFFILIYKILLNSERGPRLGPYILERGKEEVIKKLKEVL